MPDAHAPTGSEGGSEDLESPSSQDIARLCDWWCDTAVEARLTIPEMQQAARDALNALRSAPVAERMKAMGMVGIEIAVPTNADETEFTYPTAWVEAT